MAKIDATPTGQKSVQVDDEGKLQVDTFVSAGGKIDVLAGSTSDSALNKKNVSKPQHVRAAQKHVAAAQFRQVRREILRRKSEIAKANYALMQQNEKNDNIEKRKAESSRSLMYPMETPPQRRAERLRGFYRRKSDTTTSGYRSRTDSNESSKSFVFQKQIKDKYQRNVMEQDDIKIPIHRRSVVHVSGGSSDVSKTDKMPSALTSTYGSIVTSQPRALVPPPRSNEMLSDNYVPLTSEAMTSLGYSGSGYNLSDIQEVTSVTLMEIVKTGVKDFFHILYFPFKCCNKKVRLCMECQGRGFEPPPGHQSKEPQRIKHKFRFYQFQRPRICFFCRQPIYHLGSACTVCRYICHRKCELHILVSD